MFEKVHFFQFLVVHDDLFVGFDAPLHVIIFNTDLCAIRSFSFNKSVYQFLKVLLIVSKQVDVIGKV